MEKTINQSNIFLFFLFNVMFWFIVIFYSIVASLPTSAIDLDLENKTLLKTIVPQGWGFYSKDPRGEMSNVYNLDTKKQAVQWPNNRISNVFGLNRYGRGQGTEMGLLTTQVPTDKWTICDKESLDCLLDIKKSIPIVNSTPKPTICGNIGVTQEKPKPWAWSKYKNEVNLTSKVVRMNVECSKK
ncbi:SdpA family antimicrobial peptide system protein [Priestia megaterium]|uniref:SdpA family antimicrobial peptide system protein n=1 Tax=Priestia megaterium TaxID=1404 RepID=UPI0022B8BC25|nr:SdpA family antimicrobial peptide system protein [Priestia megaterium]MCZ8497363.1 SdpA family antimicrobial peptide system protein [Priestia megaterium]